MESSKKKIFVFLFVILVFLISYTRDTLFILINACISNDPNNYANTSIPDYLKQLSVAELKKLKWLLAAIFSALFTLTTTFAIHYYFRNKQFTRLTVLIYIFLGISTLGAELIKYFLNLSQLTISILHTPESIIQSPLVLLVLFSSLLIYTEKKIKVN